MTVATTKRRPPFVGMKVRIRSDAKLFPGQRTVVAYIGENENISVYLTDHDFDECVPINSDEWDEDHG